MASRSPSCYNRGIAMNPRIVCALILRYIYLYTRTPVRFIDLVFWAVVDLFVWGFMALYLQDSAGGSLPAIAGYLLGGLILWDILFRSQQGVTISFLEDIWTRNLLNIFVAPIRTGEYLAACFGSGIIRVVVTGGIMILLSWLAYSFNLFSIPFLSLIPFFLNLILFGWSLGLIATALILRWGQAAENLAWAIPFLVQPIACVFYPVSVLPGWLQGAAWCIPCTPVFEGMREALNGAPANYGLMGYALLVNLIWFIAASLFFALILKIARNKGGLTKFAAH